MKFFSKKIIAIIVCSILLITTCFVSADVNHTNETKSKNEIRKGNAISFTNDSKVLAENDKYSLVCDKKPVSFSIVSKTTSETIFSTSVSNDTYDVEGSSNTWKNYMQAIVAIKYAFKDEYKGTTIQDFSSAVTTDVSFFSVENGVWIDLYFSKPKIGFSVIIQLDGSAVNVTIPEKTIKEDDEYELISAEIFPFMGAALNNSDGYIVYPDGSGAITYFNKIEEKHLYTQAYSLDVYGSLNQGNLDDMPDGAMLPIYGVKNGNKAFLAAITDGDDSASIKINPGVNAAAVKLNRASFEFTYRNSHRFYLSNIVSNGKDVATNIYGTEWDEVLIPGDRSVKFFMLEGENADYSGMANVYRDYLIENGNLVANSNVKNYRTSVSMIMGGIEETMFASNYVTATSFDEAAKFIKQYDELGMTNYLVTLSGWNKGGINNYDNFYKPESALGGTKGLKTLNKLDVSIFLEADIVSNSTERHSIKLGNLIPVTNGEATRFISGLDGIKKKFAKLEKSLNKYNSLNVGYSGIGNELFYNADGKYTHRADEIDVIRKLLSKSDKTSVEGGNLYLLDIADYLYNIPTSTSDNVLIDEEIPLFSMVAYGSIPYSSESGNNNSDYIQTKLKWLEYGCIPYFEITKESPQVLQNSDRNFLYSSRNDYWKEKIAECNKEWVEDLSEISGAYIVEHQKISNTLVKVQYSNDYYVLINYGEETVEFNGNNIEAESYILKRE